MTLIHPSVSVGMFPLSGRLQFAHFYDVLDIGRCLEVRGEQPENETSHSES